MKNVQIISDKNPRSKKIKAALLKKLNKNNLSDKEICLVIGGDSYASDIKKK